MLPGMGATGNVGRGWGMLPWGCRVIGTPVGAGGYRDAAMGVPPACVPMSRLLDSPVRRGIGVSSAALTPERLRRPIPALCQGSWRVPTAQPGCHDNGRQPALPFRYRDSSICSGNQERGRRETLCCPPPSTLFPAVNTVPCCTRLGFSAASPVTSLPLCFGVYLHSSGPHLPTCRVPLPPQALSTTWGNAHLLKALARGSLSPVSASAWPTRAWLCWATGNPDPLGRDGSNHSPLPSCGLASQSPHRGQREGQVLGTRGSAGRGAGPPHPSQSRTTQGLSPTPPRGDRSPSSGAPKCCRSPSQARDTCGGPAGPTAAGSRLVFINQHVLLPSAPLPLHWGSRYWQQHPPHAHPQG